MGRHKSDTPKSNKSVRLLDATWERLAHHAARLGVSVNSIIAESVQAGVVMHDDEEAYPEEAQRDTVPAAKAQPQKASEAAPAIKREPPRPIMATGRPDTWPDWARKK